MIDGLMDGCWNGVRCRRGTVNQISLKILPRIKKKGCGGKEVWGRPTPASTRSAPSPRGKNGTRCRGQAQKQRWMQVGRSVWRPCWDRGRPDQGSCPTGARGCEEGKQMLSGASTHGVSGSAQRPVRWEWAWDMSPRDGAAVSKEPGFSLVEVSSATFIAALAVFLGEP